MKVIFIPVSDRPECRLALQHGFELGKQMESNVIGCHIRPHTDSDINLPSGSNESIIMADSYDMAWEAALEEKNKDEGPVKAKVLFKEIASQYGYELSKKPKNTPVANWTEKVGSPDKLFAIMGPVADLILVSRPAKKGKSLAKTFMINSVMNSSSPVLIVPQINIKTLGKRVCIAWNQSSEAALAVKAALPILRQAVEVNIITCVTEDKLGPKAAHILKYLGHWQVNAKHQKIKGASDTQAILQGYEQTNSDLLVMGGYSRSRLRERVFGGVTEYMLNEVQIPIFILHT